MAVESKTVKTQTSQQHVNSTIGWFQHLMQYLHDSIDVVTYVVICTVNWLRYINYEFIPCTSILFIIPYRELLRSDRVILWMVQRHSTCRSYL